MKKNQLGIVLASILGLSLQFSTTGEAEDLLQATMERTQKGLAQLVGDGIFDSEDEDTCLNVLGNSAIQREEVLKTAVDGVLGDSMERMRLSILASTAIDDRMMYLHLRDIVKERRDVPWLKDLSTDETKRLRLACSNLVERMLKAGSGEVALNVRGRAEQWVLGELIAAMVKTIRSVEN